VARPKEFDRDKALKRAMEVFWEHGYEATSTDQLLKAMGIGRQNLYDTFGDKRRLFLEALGLYATEGTIAAREVLTSSGSALERIHRLLFNGRGGRRCDARSRMKPR
jgi:TetR/AcrR family transcriptional regulator, transcriptional repressor for nem operon